MVLNKKRMKKWVFTLLILAIISTCSVAAITVASAECSESKIEYVEFDKRFSQTSAKYASAESVKGKLDNVDQIKTHSKKEKEFNPPISLSEPDRIFVLLVFVGSIVAAMASVISMIIKTKRSKFGRRD